jgi:hypothetical protein
LALELLADIAAETELDSWIDEAFRAFKQVIRQVLERRRRMNVRRGEKMGGWLWPIPVFSTGVPKGQKSALSGVPGALDRRPAE